MRIKSTSLIVFTLTTSTLTEVSKDSPYKLELADIDPKIQYQEVPYQMGEHVAYSHTDGKYRASTYISRSPSTRRVQLLEIGCQTFEGKTAQAIIKAVTLARKKKSKKTTKKTK